MSPALFGCWVFLVFLSLINSGECIRQAFGAGRPEKRVYGIDHRRQCAKDAPQIIGGEVVNSGDKYPFLAWIGKRDGTGLSQYCGGTLISERIVLTAAHCVGETDASNKKLYVRFKLADFGKETGIERNTVNWQRHENFNRVTMYYDLALLLLDEKIPASLVQPVMLSDGSQPFEKLGDKTISGWGSTNEECSAYDTLLRETTVPMGAYSENCQVAGSKPIGLVDDFNFSSQICAGQFQGELQYPGCGDSGGPLMAASEGGPTQVGIVSWTYGVPFPDVFTRVSAHRGWIAEAAARLEREGPRA